ncbi:MAG: RNA polymerase sigma factor [Planctomycetaceae bacterium]|nr:RNA polymerase sigma factor [Planctomycetaceae bacterium]
MVWDDGDSLVDGVMRGDDSAWRALVREYGEALVGYAARITGDASAAQDVVQAAFVSLHKSRARLPHDVSLRAYCYRIVTNLSLNHVRDEALRNEREREAATMAWEQDETPERAAMLAELWQQVAKLPTDMRLAIELRFGQGLSLKEAAAALDVPMSTLSTNQGRALEELRGRMALRASPAAMVMLGSLEDVLSKGLPSSTAIAIPSTVTLSLEGAVMAAIGVKTAKWVAAAVILLLLGVGGGVFVVYENGQPDAAPLNAGITPDQDIHRAAPSTFPETSSPSPGSGAVTETVRTEESHSDASLIYRIQVVAANDGMKPVAGAKVSGTMADSPSELWKVLAATDERGEATIAGELLDNRIRIEAQQCVDRYASVTSGGELNRILLLRTASLDVTLRTPSGFPIPNAEIFIVRQGDPVAEQLSLDGLSEREVSDTRKAYEGRTYDLMSFPTDDNGCSIGKINGLVPGTYLLYAGNLPVKSNVFRREFCPSFYPVFDEAAATESDFPELASLQAELDSLPQPVTLSPGKNSVTLTSKREIWIFGRVVTEDGKPCSGADVYLLVKRNPIAHSDEASGLSPGASLETADGAQRYFRARANEAGYFTFRSPEGFDEARVNACWKEFPNLYYRTRSRAIGWDSPYHVILADHNGFAQVGDVTLERRYRCEGQIFYDGQPKYAHLAFHTPHLSFGFETDEEGKFEVECFSGDLKQFQEGPRRSAQDNSFLLHVALPGEVEERQFNILENLLSGETIRIDIEKTSVGKVVLTLDQPLAGDEWIRTIVQRITGSGDNGELNNVFGNTWDKPAFPLVAELPPGTYQLQIQRAKRYSNEKGEHLRHEWTGISTVMSFDVLENQTVTLLAKLCVPAFIHFENQKQIAGFFVTLTDANGLAQPMAGVSPKLTQLVLPEMCYTLKIDKTQGPGYLPEAGTGNATTRSIGPFKAGEEVTIVLDEE